MAPWHTGLPNAVSPIERLAEEVVLLSVQSPKTTEELVASLQDEDAVRDAIITLGAEEAIWLGEDGRWTTDHRSYGMQSAVRVTDPEYFDHLPDLDYSDPFGTSQDWFGPFGITEGYFAVGGTPLARMLEFRGPFVAGADRYMRTVLSDVVRDVAGKCSLAECRRARSTFLDERERLLSYGPDRFAI